MPKQLKKAKPLIYVFCEGETEQAYTKFMRQQFKDFAVIKYPGTTGLFEEAYNLFKKDARYRNSAEVIDEIWFFFDVELKDRGKWDERLKIIKRLRNLRKPNIRVRLLMTTGCIEYWLMLHYKMYTPPLQTVAEKEKVIADLKKIEANYVKGSEHVVFKIAERYTTAAKNSEKTLKNLLQDGLPEIDDTDCRNQWFCSKCFTFSTLHEAIFYLDSLQQEV